MNSKELIDLSLGIIAKELAEIQVASATKPLDPHTSRKLVEYVKALVAVNKNEPAPPEEDGLDSFTDEELAQLAMDAINATQSHKKVKS